MLFTQTHMIVSSAVTSSVRVAGNRPFVELRDADDDRHTITLTLKDLDAIDGLIDALKKGRKTLAPARAGEAA